MTSSSYPYALERPHDPGSPHLEPGRVPVGEGPTYSGVTTSPPEDGSTAEPTVTPAPETVVPSTRKRAAADGERPRRGKGGARKVRTDPALAAELAGVARPAPVDEP